MTDRPPATVPSNATSAAISDLTSKLIDELRGLAHDDEQAIHELDRLSDLPAALAMVVVGETKKGKSSVVNALLRRPDTSPVAVDVATAAYVMFQFGPDEAQVWQGNGERKRVPLAELDAWVSVDGLAANPDAWAPQHDDQSTTTSPSALPVSAFVESEFLRGIAMIDTPGVGGLVGEHETVTMDAIRQAGVMLFVTDISVPLTEPEAQFLRTVLATANLVDIIIVANMSDKLIGADAKNAAVEARQRIATAIPELGTATFVAVSASRALRAMRDEHLTESARQRVRDNSGFDELERVIDQRVRQRSQLLTDGVRLQVVQTAAAAVADAAKSRHQMLSTKDTTDELNDLQDQMIALAHDVEMARLAFVNDITGLRKTLDTVVDTFFTSLGNDLDRKATDDVRHDQIATVFATQIISLTEELKQTAESGIREAINRNFEALITADASGELLWSALSAAAAQAGADIERRDGRDHQTAGTSADSMVTSAIGLTSGIALGGFLSTITGIGTAAGAAAGAGYSGLAFLAATNPIGLVLGPAIVLLNVRRVKRTTRITETRTWLRDTLTTARKDITDAVRSRFDDAAHITATALKMYMNTRSSQLRLIQRSLGAPARRKEIDAAKAEYDAANRILGTARQQLATAGMRSIEAPKKVVGG